MKAHSTKQAARLAVIHWVTLLRWVKAGKVKASDSIAENGNKHWRWSDADVEKIKKYKAAHYGEGKGPKRRK